MPAAEYLPTDLDPLLTQGVTNLGRGIIDDASWTVVVAEHAYQDGQWVGTYSKADAQRVAERIVEAIPGARCGATDRRCWKVVTGLDIGAATFRGIMEQVGYSEEDTARHLSVNKSFVQQMKSGKKRIPAWIALAMRHLQDDYADARATALDAAPAELVVWRDDTASLTATGRPARWHRMIAAECHQEHGTRVTYAGEQPTREGAH